MNKQNIQQMILNSRNATGINSNSGMAPAPPPNQTMMPMISPTGDIEAQQLARARIEYENQFGPNSFPEQTYLDAIRNAGGESSAQAVALDSATTYGPARGVQENPFEESLRITPGAVVSQEELQAQYPEGGIGGGYQSNLSDLQGVSMAGNPATLAQQQAMFEQMNPGAQGLLSGTTEIPTSGPTDAMGYSQFGNHPSVQRGLLDQDFLRQESGAVIGEDELKAQDDSGWDKDERMRMARAGGLIAQFGQNYLKEEPLTHYK